jgi:DNA polymerase III epsilon subunit-like protein
MPSVDVRLETFAVVDVETTGLDPARDRVVEVACLRIERGAVRERLVSLVNPGCAISARASAVHGITGRDVAHAPSLADLRGRLLELAAGATVVAHNARFDLGFLPFLAARPVICTLRLARHLVDAASYRNEALRERFGITLPPEFATAHRAGADAAVTAAVLGHLLERYAMGPFPQTIPGLIATIAKPASLGRFAFGAHRGTPVTRVPSGYLRWIVGAGFEDWPDVRATAERELARRHDSRRAGADKPP